MVSIILLASLVIPIVVDAQSARFGPTSTNNQGGPRQNCVSGTAVSAATGAVVKCLCPSGYTCVNELCCEDPRPQETVCWQSPSSRSSFGGACVPSTRFFFNFTSLRCETFGQLVCDDPNGGNNFASLAACQTACPSQTANAPARQAFFGRRPPGQPEEQCNPWQKCAPGAYCEQGWCRCLPETYAIGNQRFRAPYLAACMVPPDCRYSAELTPADDGVRCTRQADCPFPLRCQLNVPAGTRGRGYCCSYPGMPQVGPLALPAGFRAGH